MLQTGMAFALLGMAMLPPLEFIMTILSISPVGSTFDANYHAIEARPVGKATFKAFCLGVPKVYFDQHPVSPQWAQDAIVSLTLDAIRIKAVAARNAGLVSFEIPDRLPDFLESLATSSRLSKVDLEAWVKANSGLLEDFLMEVRGHAEDAALPNKVQVLGDLVTKAGAPVPPWNEAHQALLASLFDWLASQEAMENDAILPRLLSKLASLQQSKADLAAAL